MDIYHYFKFNEANFRAGYWPSKYHIDDIWADYEHNNIGFSDNINRANYETPIGFVTLCKKCRVWYKKGTKHYCNLFNDPDVIAYGKKLAKENEERKPEVIEEKIKVPRDKYFDGLFEKRLVKTSKVKKERPEHYCFMCNDIAVLHRKVKKNGSWHTEHSCIDHLKDLQEWQIK